MDKLDEVLSMDRVAALAHLSRLYRRLEHEWRQKNDATRAREAVMLEHASDLAALNIAMDCLKSPELKG